MSEFTEITINGVPVYPDTKEPITGNVFFVHHSGSDNNPAGTSDLPFATWDHAFSHCTANHGDVVFIKPGHAETVATATAFDHDVAGVSCYGLGSGNDRPKITVGSAATATLTVSAASAKWRNLVIIGALDGLNTALTVTGNDADLQFEYRDTSSTVEADIVVTATGDRLKLNIMDIGFPAGDQRDQTVVLTGVDNARVHVDMYGKVATAVVNFVGTSCTNVIVTGSTYVSGTTDGSKNVVDTIGSSTWYMDIVDFAAGARYTGGSGAAVASDDISVLAATLGTVAEAAATGAVTATDNAMAYIKQLVTELQVVDGYFDVPTADATTDTTIRDVVGRKTDAAVGAVTTTKSLMAYLKGVLNAVTTGALSVQERVAVSGTKVMVNGDTLFTVAGGPIEIEGLWSECVTDNDGTASTLQYSVTHATLGDVTISNASGSLASVGAGSHVTLQMTALSTAALLSTEGATIHATGPSKILMQPGAIKAVIGTGSTTGTWKHYLRYKPMAVGVTVT